APVSITANATVAASCSLASTAAGTYGATITGIGSPGTASHFAVATVHVGDFSISATSPSGATSTSISSSITLTSTFNFVGSVALGDTVPSGLTCQPFSPTATVPLSANGTGMASISCTSTTANAFIVGINGVGSPGTASHSTTATFTFTGLVDFTISATSPSGATGTSMSSTITLTSTFNFVGSVALSDTPLPAGVICNAFTVTPVSLTANGTGTSQLSCTSPTAGAFSVTITGTGSPGTASHPTTAVFTFATVDFSISATSPADFNTGATGTSTITTTPI